MLSNVYFSSIYLVVNEWYPFKYSFSRIHSFIYTWEVEYLLIYISLYLFCEENKLRYCLSLCPHLSSYFGSEIYNIPFVVFRHPKSEGSQYIREVYCFKTAEKKILDSDKNTRVTHVYEYIKSWNNILKHSVKLISCFLI